MIVLAKLVAAFLLNATPGEPIVSALDTACDPGAARIMILGSYHMANPGLDQVNVEADDVLSARRQAEIAALVDALTAYAPTKVMLEANRASIVTQRDYVAFREGGYTLSRNETNQIGYRLAARMNLDAVHPIDFPMMMSGLRQDELDSSLPAHPASEASGGPAAPPRELSEDELALRSMTVSQYLRRQNDLDDVRRSHAGYMNLFDFDDQNPAIYERADRLANWYKRNIRMFANIARDSAPGDRVFVLVGAGHLHMLREFAIESRRFCLVEPFNYLPT